MKSIAFGRLILAVVAVLFGSESFLYAGNQVIDIDLRLTSGKQYYGFREEIPVTVQVRNKSNKRILIDRGFSSRTFHLDMQVIDPAGRLLTAIRPDKPHPVPHAPPLPFMLYQRRPVRAAPCEVLLSSYKNDKQKIHDLNDFYPLELPGYYSAQIQVSTMIFKGICDVDKPLWMGLLKSNTLYFYMAGETEFHVDPPEWNLAWTNPSQSKTVKIFIKCGKGKTWKDYDWKKGFYFDHIFSNKKIKLNVEKLGSQNPYCFMVSINGRQAIKSLKHIRTYKSLPVTVTGWLKNGLPFGGGQNIKIIP